MTNILQTIVTDAENAEAWVVGEIQKVWSAVSSAEQTIVADINGIFAWLKANQAQIQSVFSTLLNEVIPVAAAVTTAVAPAAAPAVAAGVAIATTTLDASEAAIDALSQQVLNGSTTATTVSSAYQAYKAAEKAVNTVLTGQAAPPASVPAAASTTPVTQAPATS